MVRAQISRYISRPKYTRQSPDCPLVIFSFTALPSCLHCSALLPSLLYIVQLCLCPALHCRSSWLSSLLHTHAPSSPLSSKSIAFRSRVLATSATTAYNKQWVATACGVASHLNGRRNHRAYRLLIKFSVTPESRSAVALALLLDMCKNTNDLTNIHDLS